MLLRRITEHVKAQNWFAVGLDFLIVVMGVFMGLQLDNWNAERLDRISEKKIISYLYADFEALGKETNEKIEFLSSISNDIAAINDLIVQDPEGLDAQRLRIFYETAFSLPPFSGQSDSYEQLVSSGEMNLLRNDELRAELVAHASLTRDLAYRDQAVREWSRPYLTSLVRLDSLIEAMPLDEALLEAGSMADLIVAIGMYQNIYQNHHEAHQQHRESFSKLEAMLLEEVN